MSRAKQSKNTSRKASEHASASPTLGVIQPAGFAGIPEGWNSISESFSSRDGMQLFWMVHSRAPGAAERAPGTAERAEAPTRDIKRVLLIIHGLGEHGGRYLHFPAALADEVDVVAMLDLRGHGRSEGTRGYVNSFDEYVDDAMVALLRLQSRYPEAELHLYAHSMGGLVALNLLIREKDLPLRSVTLSAPLLKIKADVPVVKSVAGRLLSKVWGNLQMESELDAQQLSHDPEVVRAYQQDRLVHSKVTPSLFVSMNAAMAKVLAYSDPYPYAMLWIVPLADSIVDPVTTQKYFEGVKAHEKVIRAYPKLYHEPHNELEKGEVLGEIKKWIKQHAKA